MAYVIGILSRIELNTLKHRGWDLEEPPKELIPKDIPKDYVCKMVFVDTSMFDVMSGPDWDTGEGNRNGT